MSARSVSSPAPPPTRWSSWSTAIRRFLDSDKGVSLFDLDEAQVRLAQGYDIVHTAYTARWDDQVPRLIGAGCRVAYDFAPRLLARHDRRATPACGWPPSPAPTSTRRAWTRPRAPPSPRAAATC